MKATVDARAQGDRARDLGNWAEAASAYLKYLSSNSDDFGIWVQAGNCMKEDKNYEGAQSAYERAIALRSDDADVYLQFGHLKKLMDRPGEAIEAYKTSYLIKPSKDPKRELATLGYNISDDPDFDSIIDDRTSLTFFEIDDFFNYMKAHQTLSGIQRVQAAIAEQILKSKDLNDQQCSFIVRGSEFNDYYVVNPDELRAIIRYVSGPAVNHDTLRSMIARAENGAQEVVPTKGDCYIVLGAFWAFGAVASRYKYLKAAGVVTGVYIYDIIPYSHPEFCHDTLVHDFVLSLGDVLAVFDFILTISEFTATEVKRVVERFDLPQRPIIPVPLAHNLSLDAVQSARKKIPLRGELTFLSERPYVLYVSTIEGRKNHAYLISIWKQLILEGVDVPDLVFVGRKGWRVAGLFDVLDATDNLDQRVHILHDLSDMQLQSLYYNCMFTAFTSFVEGWGLPVGESLSHGKLCVASNSSSVPEVGGEFVEYVDPLNVQQGIAAIRKLITEPGYLERRTNQILTKFVARSWADVARDFIGAMNSCISLVQAAPNIHPAFPPGELFRPGTLSFGNPIPKDYFKRPLRLLLSDKWHRAEGFGVWMDGSEASITFKPVLDSESDRAIIFVGVLAAPDNNMEVEVAASTDEQRKAIFSNGSKTVRRLRLTPHVSYVKLEVPLTKSDLLTVRFRLLEKITAKPDDNRLIALGLTMIAYCGNKDLLSRITIAEEMLLGQATVETVGKS